MDNREYVHCPVMNFLQNNWEEGIEEATIIQHAIDFFECGVIADAKSEFWAKVAPNDNCPRRIGAKASANNVKDILDFIKKLDSEEVSTPIYVIKSPTEVPVLPAVAYSRLSTKVNRVEQLLKVVATKLDAYELNYPQLPKPAIPDSHATIVVSNLPSTLSDPIKQKDLIDQIDGHESITSIRPVRDKLFINIDKSVAEDFRLSVTSAFTGSSAKVLTKKFYGLLKGIPHDFELSHLISRPGVSGASRLGKSLAVKLEFSDATSRVEAFRYGLKVGYEILSVYEFKAIPRCCNNCRSPDHLQSSCPSVTPKCARCAGPHVSDRDSPCNLSPKCANCGGDHVSFSLTCPKLKAIVSRKLPKTN